MCFGTFLVISFVLVLLAFGALVGTVAWIVAQCSIELLGGIFRGGCLRSGSWRFEPIRGATFLAYRTSMCSAAIANFLVVEMFRPELPSMAVVPIT